MKPLRRGGSSLYQEIVNFVSTHKGTPFRHCYFVNIFSIPLLHFFSLHDKLLTKLILSETYPNQRFRRGDPRRPPTGSSLRLIRQTETAKPLISPLRLQGRFLISYLIFRKKQSPGLWPGLCFLQIHHLTEYTSAIPESFYRKMLANSLYNRTSTHGYEYRVSPNILQTSFSKPRCC